jgi:hypothetical protein
LRDTRPGGRLSVGRPRQRGRWEPDYFYTGLHSFVFVNEVDPGINIRTVIDSVREFPRRQVLFASELVGSSIGFAHLRVEGEGDLSGLQDFIAGELWERGVHCEHSTEVKVAKQGEKLMGAKRTTPEVLALVRIKTAPRRLDEVLETLSAETGELAETFRGASIVAGNYDILLQLGADEFQTVVDAVYGPLQLVEGIRQTDTAFTDARRYE